jgi:hypothetical protein
MSKPRTTRRTAAQGAATAPAAQAPVLEVSLQSMRAKEDIFTGSGELDCLHQLTVPEFCQEYGLSKIRVMEFENDEGELVWKVKGAKIYAGPSCFEEFDELQDLKDELRANPDDFVIAWFEPQRDDYNSEVIRLVYMG